MRIDNVITPTRVELGSRCYRRHAIIDLLEKGLEKAPFLAFGNVIHAGAAEHWRKGDVRQALEKEFEVNKQDLNEKHTLELALAMFDVYQRDAKLAGPFSDDNFKIVTIEERLPVTLPNGSTMTFQLDRLLEQDNRRLFLLDTKSAAKLDQRWRSAWDKSLQFKLYKWAISQLYDMPVDIVIEGVLKTPKSKVEYYLVPDWDEEELDEAVWLATEIVEQDKRLLDILTLQGEDAMIENVLTRTPFNYQDCYSYNAPCPILELCTLPPSLRRATLDAKYIHIPADY